MLPSGSRPPSRRRPPRRRADRRAGPGRGPDAGGVRAPPEADAAGEKSL